MKHKTTRVHLISESTGSLARHLASVVLSQFPNFQYEVVEHRFCNRNDALCRATERVEREGHAIVLSALTATRLRRSLTAWCERKGVPHHELVQPLADFVVVETGFKPVRDVSRAHPCDDRYFRRIAALEFTLQHDDSRRIETSQEADVMLVGVSRVGKTPIAAYLGLQGYKVANISLAQEVSPPAVLREHREKCVGLTMDAQRLATIRKRRFERNRFVAVRETAKHFSRRATLNDLIYAEDLLRKLGIPLLDVTDLTVEEAAARVLDRLPDSPRLGQE